MSEYAAVPSTGKLKLKGVKDGRVDKKKKEKKKNRPQAGNEDSNEGRIQDNSVVLKALEDEDQAIRKESRDQMGEVDGKELDVDVGVEDVDVREHLKTEAEKRHDTQRRKRLEERMKKEGVKSHVQRVEELNKYLSSLSEHHDMPKIGPG